MAKHKDYFSGQDGWDWLMNNIKELDAILDDDDEEENAKELDRIRQGEGDDPPEVWYGVPGMHVDN